MDKLQLLSFFAAGFFLSRLIIAVQLPEHLVARLLGSGEASLTRLSFYLLALAAGLSFFIPNAVTVLTLLPVVKLARETFTDRRAPDDVRDHDATLSTLLALAVIYGANIGGLGSVTATPSNGLFVAWLEAKLVVGRHAVQFASWLAWGVPLALTLSLCAWLVLLVTLRPWRWRARALTLYEPAAALGGASSAPAATSSTLLSGRRGWTVALTAIYFAGATGLSLAMLRARTDQVLWVLAASAGATLALLVLLFVLPVRDESGARRPLLSWADCTGDLPWRGFALVGVAVAIGGVLYALKLHRTFARWAASVVPSRLGFFPLLLTLSLTTTFATEVLSNTAVQLGLFVAIGPSVQGLGHSTLRALLAVTLSCTCAFMSPIATGVNGLAFGGVRGVSLWRMLAVGLLMNVVAALLVSCWLRWVVWW
jgi:sodium-dependent dicarboxylate transporter 2/3/5